MERSVASTSFWLDGNKSAHASAIFLQPAHTASGASTPKLLTATFPGARRPSTNRNPPSPAHKRPDEVLVQPVARRPMPIVRGFELELLSLCSVGSFRPGGGGWGRPWLARSGLVHPRSSVGFQLSSKCHVNCFGGPKMTKSLARVTPFVCMSRKFAQ